jgi:TRAP-type C4-dicarboxylate transport system substrate-binding protein
MKKRTVSLISAVTIALFALAPMASAASVNWPLAILWPAGNFSTQGTMEFAELVKERTNGEVDIVVHPGGALGFKGPEMLKVIRDGLAPIGEMLLGYVAGTEPIMDFSTMPFLVADADEAEQLGKLARGHIEQVFDKWDQKLLYWQFWPGAGIYSQKPIASLDDLKGLKIRTFNAVSTDWVKSAGGNPVSMPWGDVYMAMSTGAIDALITSTTSGADGKFWEVMKRRADHQHHLGRRRQILGGHEAFHAPQLHLRLQRGHRKQEGLGGTERSAAESDPGNRQGNGRQTAAKEPRIGPAGHREDRAGRHRDSRHESGISEDLRPAGRTDLEGVGQESRARGRGHPAEGKNDGIIGSGTRGIWCAAAQSLQRFSMT